MTGLTKAQIDTSEAGNLVGGKSLRPRDAATLILIDRSSGGFNVLMGRRHARHAFMPGKFVFPGGRTDPADARIAVAEDLHPRELAKLTIGSSRLTATRARAIALSAIRETYEEAGLLIGRAGAFATNKPDWNGFAEHSVRPSLEACASSPAPSRRPGGCAVSTRASSPPGVRTSRLRLKDGGPTNELEEIVWLPIEEAQGADIPLITKTVLQNLQRRLARDPDLAPGGPVPFYRLVGKSFVDDLL